MVIISKYRSFNDHWHFHDSISVNVNEKIPTPQVFRIVLFSNIINKMIKEAQANNKEG